MVSADAEGGKLRVSLRQGSSTNIEEYLLTDRTYYTWARGESGYYSGKRGDFTGPQIMMAATCEELLQLPQEAFQDASILWDGDQECLAITVLDPVSGYRMEYRIAVRDGLLISMEAFDGTRGVYRVERLILETGVVRIGAFVLPDGSQPDAGVQ